MIAALGPHGATIAPRPGLVDGRVDDLPAAETRLLSARETIERYRDQREWLQSDDAEGFAQFQDDGRIRDADSHAHPWSQRLAAVVAGATACMASTHGDATFRRIALR